MPRRPPSAGYPRGNDFSHFRDPASRRRCRVASSVTERRHARTHSRLRRHLGDRPRRRSPLRRCPCIDLARRPARRGARGQRGDLRVRGAADVRTAVLDADDMPRHAEVIAAAFAAFGGFDAVLVAWGVLPDQAASERLPNRARQLRHQRALGDRAVDRARQPVRKPGTGRDRRPVVAGRRPRPGQQLRVRRGQGGRDRVRLGLAQPASPEGVRVLTIEPGFVDTPMTASFTKGPLWARPERVAEDIVRARRGASASSTRPGSGAGSWRSSASFRSGCSFE